MKLRDCLRLKETNGMFGVELEIEGKNLPEDIPLEWRMEHDGSLRGEYPRECAEYIFRKPYDPTKAKLAINKLINHLKEEEAVPNFSFRTSLHVHVNCQELTWDEYSAFLYTSLLMERVLLRYCGESRIGNRFCLRISDAEGYADDLISLFSRGFKYFLAGDGSPNRVKYSAINIAPTAQYGSIEFRGMRGTVDKAVIFNWLDALEAIYTFSIKKGSVKDVHSYFVQSDIKDFMKEVLGKSFDALYYKDSYDDVRLNHSILIDVAYNTFKDKVREEEMPWVIKANKLPKRVIWDMPDGAAPIILDERMRLNEAVRYEF